MNRRVREEGLIPVDDTLSSLPPEVAAPIAESIGGNLLSSHQFDEAAAFVRAIHPSPEEWMYQVEFSRERYALEQSQPYQNTQRWLDYNEGDVAALIDATEDFTLRDTLARHWLRRDPEAAVAYFENHRGPPRQRFLTEARARLAIWRHIQGNEHTHR